MRIYHRRIEHSLVSILSLHSSRWLKTGHDQPGNRGIHIDTLHVEDKHAVIIPVRHGLFQCSLEHRVRVDKTAMLLCRNAVTQLQ